MRSIPPPAVVFGAIALYVFVIVAGRAWLRHLGDR